MSVQEENFSAIAEAIREKTGTEEPIKATEFAGAVRAIPTGMTREEADARYVRGNRNVMSFELEDTYSDATVLNLRASVPEDFDFKKTGLMNINFSVYDPHLDVSLSGLTFSVPVLTVLNFSGKSIVWAAGKSDDNSEVLVPCQLNVFAGSDGMGIKVELRVMGFYMKKSSGGDSQTYTATIENLSFLAEVDGNGCLFFEDTSL